MRIAAGVASIMVSGVVGLVGFAATADGFTGLIAGEYDVRVTNVWQIDDELCPQAVRVSYSEGHGMYDCPDPGVRVGDRLTLYKSFFDDSFGTRGDQILFVVLGSLLFLAMTLVVAAVGYLLIKDVDTGAQPTG